MSVEGVPVRADELAVQTGKHSGGGDRLRQTDNDNDNDNDNDR